MTSWTAVTISVEASFSSPRWNEPFDDVPVRFLTFDLLQLGTKSLLRQPYEERRGLLAGLAMPDPYRISVVRQFTFTELAADRRTPQDLLGHVAATGHEGLVAKLLRAPYAPGLLVQARPHPDR